ncbi:MAG: GNAT family N-acetyltransferase [Pseudomonadota bacterium]
MDVKIDSLAASDVQELLSDHLADMARHSPPESIHALDVTGLARPEVTFWTAREAGELLGCAALRELSIHEGEVKSMRTSSHHLRKGVASTLLSHLVATAEARGYRRLFLETGSMAAFAPARELYLRFGFEYCEPFADYVLDPYSVFMSKSR